MAKSYFNRYVWLIDTIQRHGHISRMELNRLWEESPLNETREKLYERYVANQQLPYYYAGADVSSNERRRATQPGRTASCYRFAGL